MYAIATGARVDSWKFLPGLEAVLPYPQITEIATVRAAGTTIRQNRSLRRRRLRRCIPPIGACTQRIGQIPLALPCDRETGLRRDAYYPANDNSQLDVRSAGVLPKGVTPRGAKQIHNSDMATRTSVMPAKHWWDDASPEAMGCPDESGIGCAIKSRAS